MSNTSDDALSEEKASARQSGRLIAVVVGIDQYADSRVPGLRSPSTMLKA